MDQEKLKKSLLRFGDTINIEYYDILDSTNEYAKDNSSSDGSLLICDHQTKGRGRYNRVWQAEKGNDLTFTLVKCFKVSMDEIVIINFYVTYILFRTLKQFLKENVNISLKWPNDILINSKKVSGILIEVKDINKADKKFIIGIGINVNQQKFPEEISQKATSLFLESGEKVEREKLLGEIINSFYVNFDLLNDKEHLLKLWRDNFSYINKEIMIRKFVDDEEIPAIVRDIGMDGGLIVEHSDGSRSTYYSGEISLSYSNL